MLICLIINTNLGFGQALHINSSGDVDMNSQGLYSKSNGQTSIGEGNRSFSDQYNDFVVKDTYGGDDASEDAKIYFRIDNGNSFLFIVKEGNNERANLGFFDHDMDYRFYTGLTDEDDASYGDGDEFFIGKRPGGDSAALWIEQDGRVGIGYTNFTVNDTFKLIVNGDALAYGHSWHASDKRLKQNINDIESSLDKILQMRGITYNSIQEENVKTLVEPRTDSLGNPIPTEPEVPGLLKRKRIGLVAQEVKEIAPELVVQTGQGFYAVNYEGLIPMLIEAIKEQQSLLGINNLRSYNDSIKLAEMESRIAYLESQVTDIQSNCCSESNLKSSKIGESTDGFVKNSEQMASLSQNQPNPFTQATEIRYYLPDETQQATLYIYDMQGKPVKSYRITEWGSGNFIIQGNELAPGMYLYSLIADGKEVDTKRMILTN